MWRATHCAATDRVSLVVTVPPHRGSLTGRRARNDVYFADWSRPGRYRFCRKGLVPVASR